MPFSVSCSTVSPYLQVVTWPCVTITHYHSASGRCSWRACCGISRVHLSTYEMSSKFTIQVHNFCVHRQHKLLKLSSTPVTAGSPRCAGTHRLTAHPPDRTADLYSTAFPQLTSIYYFSPNGSLSVSCLALEADRSGWRVLEPWDL